MALSAQILLLLLIQAIVYVAKDIGCGKQQEEQHRQRRKGIRYFILSQVDGPQERNGFDLSDLCSTLA